MVISQGEVWWADIPPPTGSGPGFRRPVVVVQGDALNRSRIATVVCVPLTSNLKWALAAGNLRLSARVTGLLKDSVANDPKSSASKTCSVLALAGSRTQNWNYYAHQESAVCPTSMSAGPW